MKFALESASRKLEPSLLHYNLQSGPIAEAARGGMSREADGSRAPRFPSPINPPNHSNKSGPERSETKAGRLFHSLLISGVRASGKRVQTKAMPKDNLHDEGFRTSGA